MWSTFKYFIILIVSTYYILCISWIIKCLIIIDARCKHEDRGNSRSAVAMAVQETMSNQEHSTPQGALESERQALKLSS